MNYLTPDEYELHGLETATPEHWVKAASGLIDSACRRKTLAPQSYKERIRLSEGNRSVQLSFLPLATVAAATNPFSSVRARFARPRRGAMAELTVDVATAFGLPGTWTNLDANAIEFDAETGEVNLPMNLLGMSYNEVEVSYTAGLSDIPDEIKLACAQIVRNAQATPALNVKSGNVQQMRIEYFADALLDASVRRLIAPYVAQRLT